MSPPNSPTNIEQRVDELERVVRELRRDVEVEHRRTLSEVKAELASAFGAFTRHIDDRFAPWLEKLQHTDSVSALAARMTEILDLLAGTRLALDKRNAFDEIAAQTEVRKAAEHRASELRLKKWGPVIGIVGTLLGLALSALLSHWFK